MNHIFFNFSLGEVHPIFDVTILWSRYLTDEKLKCSIAITSMFSNLQKLPAILMP
jgi:hypothetical protein